MTVGPVPHVAKPRRTPSRLVQKRIFWPPSWDMANCYVMVGHPAMSDLGPFSDLGARSCEVRFTRHLKNRHRQAKARPYAPAGDSLPGGDAAYPKEVPP